MVSPDDLLLFAKSAAVILAAQLPLREEIACSFGFSAATSALLLIPFLAVLIGRKRVLPLLQSGKPPCCAEENWWRRASVSGCLPIWAGRASAG